MYYVYGFMYGEKMKYGLAKSIYAPKRMYENPGRKIEIFYSSPNYIEAREIFIDLKKKEADRQLQLQNFTVVDENNVICECGANIKKTAIPRHFGGAAHWEKLGRENPEKYLVFSLECQITGDICISTGPKSANTKILRMPPKKSLKYQIIKRGDYICRILGEFPTLSGASSFKQTKNAKIGN
jgi:hypothetical protein